MSKSAYLYVEGIERGRDTGVNFSNVAYFDTPFLDDWNGMSAGVLREVMGSLVKWVRVSGGSDDLIEQLSKLQTELEWVRDDAILEWL